MITRSSPSSSFKLRSSRSFAVSLRPLVSVSVSLRPLVSVSVTPGAYPAPPLVDLLFERLVGLLEAYGVGAQRVERLPHRPRPLAVRRSLEAPDVARVAVQLRDEVVVLGLRVLGRVELLELRRGGVERPPRLVERRDPLPQGARGRHSLVRGVERAAQRLDRRLDVRLVAVALAVAAADERERDREENHPSHAPRAIRRHRSPPPGR